MLKTLLEGFSREIQRYRKNGQFSAQWVTDGYWIDQRWLHGAVWGALIRAVPNENLALVEPTLSKGFKPDLVILAKEKEFEEPHKVAVIEYESSNSSDPRLVEKDLKHFYRAILEYKGLNNQKSEAAWQLPKLWLMISTLPDKEVIRWPWHGYSKNYGPSPNRKERDKNPLKYLEDYVHEECKTVWNKLLKFKELPLDGIQIVWANIDQTHIRVMNINGEAQEKRINDVRQAIPGRLEFPLFE